MSASSSKSAGALVELEAYRTQTVTSLDPRIHHRPPNSYKGYILANEPIINSSESETAPSASSSEHGLRGSPVRSPRLVAIVAAGQLPADRDRGTR